MRPIEIKNLREDLGWSQAKLGNYLGYTATTVMKWEKGQSPPPDVIKGLLYQLQAQLDARKEQQKREFIEGLKAVAITGGVLAFMAYIFQEKKEEDDG